MSCHAWALWIDPRQECHQSLGRLAALIENYARDHESRYPNNLEELVPDYLLEIPVCPYLQTESWSPTYLTSSDRKVYGLVCTLDHRAMGPCYPGESGMPFGTGDDPYLEQCRETLRAKGAFVQSHFDKHGQLPEDLKSFHPTMIRSKAEARFFQACESQQRLVVGPNGSFQILCAGMTHVVKDGLLPLEPRFDSRSKTLTKRKLRCFVPQPAPPWRGQLVGSIVVLAISLELVRRRHQRRVNQRKRPEMF